MKYIILTVNIIFFSYFSYADSLTYGIVEEWGYPSEGLTNKMYVQVDGGNGFSLALSTNHSIIGWGENSYGQASPPSGTNFIKISAGDYHGLALKDDGSLVVWGGYPDSDYDALTNIPMGNDFIDISAGGKFNLALKKDHSIVAWGNNDQGQVSNAPAGYNYKSVKAGFAHGVALKIDGSVVVWGGYPEDHDALMNIPPGNDFISVDAGGAHCVAIHADGSPVAWGNNDFGQVDVPSNKLFYNLVAGESHTLGIQLDGTLVAWGNNSDGQTNCPQGNTFVQIGAGSFNSLAINYSGLSANILADRTIGLYTLPVQFLAGTSGTNVNNIYYQWDFQNDGIVDIEGWGINSPTNFYTNGIYSVKLAVSNIENDTAYNLRTDFINVMDKGVGADFTANSLTGVAPFSVQFINLSSNVPQYWEWDFNSDGIIDNEKSNPKYTYTSTGSYTVSLLVSNNFGIGSGASYDSVTKLNYITVVPAVSADFYVDKLRAATDESIHFTDNSTNNPTEWNWDFNSDGIIDSTDQNPDYSYSSSGYKSVTLICKNEYSTSTNTKYNLITITTTNSNLFVSKEGAHIPPFDSWSSAATNIQDAINITLPGTEIFITNGIYSSKGYYGNGTNVIIVPHKIKLIGCGNVVIDGQSIMRGGLIISSEVYRIKFINGYAQNNGGNVLAVNSSFDSCLFIDGSSVNGGGLFLTNNSEIYNCTIADNSASEIGGGVFIAGENEVWNSIIYNNYSPVGSNYYFSGNINLSYSCTLPALSSGGMANIYENPEFIADYKISDSSPCVDAGYTFNWLYFEKDYFGNDRVFSDAVDIGAYETDVPEPVSFILMYFLIVISFIRSRKL